MNELPEERLWRLMRGALTARALALVAGLGVADALGEGSRPGAEVAGQVGADAGTLHRLLRALASDGVFAEDAPGVFRNTEVSALLRGPDWRASAQLLGGVWHRAAGERPRPSAWSASRRYRRRVGCGDRVGWGPGRVRAKAAGRRQHQVHQQVRQQVHRCGGEPGQQQTEDHVPGLPQRRAPREMRYRQFRA
jgi:hypothetical protein